MDLSLLAGNRPLKRQLEAETARRGLSHAYILTGPSGSGKKTLAGLLSAAMVCTGEGERPCGRCSGCRKALAGIHPDISSLAPQGKELVVDQIRAMRSDAYIKPNEAARKVYLIHQAQAMNESAQNAMLKLLEEGPPYAAFLLLTENADMLLPTVRSRCQVLTLDPVTPQEALRFLEIRFPKRAPQQRQEAALRCEGILGRAVEELEGKPGSALSQELQTAGELLRRLAAGQEAEVAEICVQMDVEKWDGSRLQAVLEELTLLLRDALTLSWGVSLEADPRRQALAAEAAAALSPKALNGALDLTRELLTAVKGNLGKGHGVGWLAVGLAQFCKNG